MAEQVRLSDSTSTILATRLRLTLCVLSTDREGVPEAAWSQCWVRCASAASFAASGLACCYALARLGFALEGTRKPCETTAQIIRQK